MSRYAHRLNLTVSFLFLLAGGIHSFASETLYRIAVVALLFLLHTLWMRSVVRRTKINLINEIDRRRCAHANQQTNHAETVQYQAVPSLHHESHPR